MYNSVEELICNTPLIKMPYDVTGLKNIDVYVKCELFNPFGSLKDKTAYYMIKDNIEEIRKQNKTIIESSSGNTAKALACIASKYGIPFKTVTNRIKIPETKDILKLIGAEIQEFPGLSECPDPNDPNDPINYIQRLTNASQEYFHTSQYTNPKNIQAHYELTGKEILKHLAKVDYFFGTLGTTGSSGGTLNALKEANPDIQSYGIVATKGDVIPGIRNLDEMYEVGIFNKSNYNEILSISSMNAIDGMLTLIRKFELLAGPTSGACYQATIDKLKEIDETLNERKTAVFIACDRVEPYISYIKQRRPDIFADVEVNSFRNITSEDLNNANLLDVNNLAEFLSTKPIIIDLRGNMAYNISHVKGSINITDVDFEMILDNGIPFAEDSNVLLICARGDKSKIYSAYLAKNGITVFSLVDGMRALRDFGYPLERKNIL